jgi:uncharacterized protein
MRRLTEPLPARGRITSLDAVRGVAVLGILPMNVVAFALLASAYFNISGPGSDTWLDWSIGVFGEVFLDQKFMALFSMLFGAGIVLFAERAASKTQHPVLLSLWRNFLLLIIGLLHGVLWEGDILAVYAVLSPVLLLVRHWPRALLLALGVGVYSLSPVTSIVGQSFVSGPSDLSGFWTEDQNMTELAEFVLLGDSFARALGAMLIGIALYRMQILQGNRSRQFFRRMAFWGLGVGIPLSALGAAWVIIEGFSVDVALVGSIPNTIATIPIALGYLAVIILWNADKESTSRSMIRAVGRMALTNYLSQAVLGVLVFSLALSSLDISRTGAAFFVALMWALQLWWSPTWLARFRYGPVEWLWRSCTYRAWQPLRRERNQENAT